MTIGCICVVLLSIAVGQATNLGDNEIVFNGFLDQHQTDIYWMDIAHHLVYRLTNNRASESAPVWSPDRQQIAYVTSYINENAGGSSVIVKNIKNNTVQVLSDNITNEGYPQWSPDGRYIAYGKVPYSGGLPELIIRDFQSGSVRHITDYPRSASFPTWSPDGRYIAFTSGSMNPENYEIHVVDLQTGKVRPLVTTPDGGFFPSWSPDGRYIAYKIMGAIHHIYLWDTIQMRSILLYTPSNTGIQTLAWSSDSRSIIFSDSLITGYSGVFRLEIVACIQNPITCSPQLLTPKNGSYYDPHWRPHQP